MHKIHEGGPEWLPIYTVYVVGTLVSAILILTILGMIARRIAIAKGLPPRSYFWAGFFFGPIAILIALIMPRQSQ
jgi:hypothetical protein